MALAFKQKYKESMKGVFNDIRIWILIFFAIRLFGITNPPLEVSHNWRQTTVTMAARNFSEIDNNILYPRIDIAGEKSGITGMEFPLLNYFIYGIAEIFGYQHWYGRLINLIFSSFGLWFFYKSISIFFNNKVAFYSTIILSVSIWFQFSRKIMPDTFSMSLIIASIYYGFKYLKNENNKNDITYILLYFILMLLGILTKLPSGYLLVVFLLLYLNNQISLKRKIVFTSLTILGFLPIALWYFYWVPHLVNHYGFMYFFMGKNFSEGFYEILQSLNITFSRFYETALSFIGFTAFLYGIFIAIIKKDWKIYTFLMITLIAFSVIIFKAGFTFSLHSYYIIPFVPVLALVAGYGISSIKYPRIALIVLIALSIENIANQQHDFRIKKTDLPILNLEADFDKVSKKDDLILINSGLYPTPMYFAHRRGWINSNEKILDDSYINSLKMEGLKFILILKKSFGTEIILNNHKKVLENEDYCIYAL